MSISLHKIITGFEYLKTDYSFITSLGLGIIQFILILFLGILSYGLIKRKKYARWISILFFLCLVVAYNLFIVVLGDGPINIMKFALIHLISLYYIYQLIFNDAIKQFFRMNHSHVVVKKRLKNNLIFHDD
jgi:hypothetical protein